MRPLPFLRWSVAALLLLATVAWFAVRRAGVLLPWAVALLAACTTVVAAAVAVADLTLLRRERRLVRLGSVLVFGGLAFSGGVGSYGWLRSVQGFVLLAEGEPFPVATPADLQKHWGGPLGDVRELRGAIVLEKLVLEPIERGFRPMSRVVLRSESGDTRTVEVTQDASVSVGSLRLHQGAFGFAPRITLLRDGKTVFDEHVPFRTRILGGRAVAFDGEVEIPAAGLRVAGEVDLSTLDARMRGHPALHLAVSRDGVEIGGGSLLPGHGATVEGGYRITYAGLRRWSEIDVRRQTPVGGVRVGLVVAAAGLLLWPLAAWRGW
jgi:hypothetical protein